jgi:hypothetical protein
MNDAKRNPMADAAQPVRRTMVTVGGTPMRVELDGWRLVVSRDRAVPGDPPRNEPPRAIRPPRAD